MKALMLITALAAVPTLAFASAPAGKAPANCGTQGTQCQMAATADPSPCSPLDAVRQPGRSDRMLNGGH